VASLRPSARAGPQEEDKQSPLDWTPKRALGYGIVGLLLLGGAIFTAYSTGAGHPAWIAASLIGSISLGLAFPGFGTSRKLSRVLNVLLCLMAVWLADPVSLAADNTSRFEGLAAADVTERVAALRKLRAAGETTFTSLDLSGADLSQLDLKGAVLDGCKLRDANLRGTNLSNASLLNVDVNSADFAGAELGGINPTFLKGWAFAKCDDSTTMPKGWSCPAGSPESKSQ
jgi:hypothetical protein